MLRLAPPIGVSLSVALLFGPLNSTAQNSGANGVETTWAVLVADQDADAPNRYCFAPVPGYPATCYQIAWSGGDYRECTRRAEMVTGRCIPVPDR